MNPLRGVWENAVAALADEPGACGIAGPDARVLVWSLDGERLLWTSHAAAELGSRWAGRDPNWAGPLDRDRLRVLGRGAALRYGFRLERWRSARDPLASPVTVACRIISAETGEDGLLVALPCAASPAGDGPPGNSLTATGASADARGPLQEPASEPPIRLPRRRSTVRGTRFLWRADPDGRFTQVSDGLAAGVGRAASRVAGRRWRDLVGPLVYDPEGAVAARLASRSAWSRLPVAWRDVEQDRAVPVEISGAPILAADQTLAGFRGFGQAYRQDAVPAEGLFSDLSGIAPTETPSSPWRPSDQLAGLDQAINAAAALTGSAGETVFNVLRAFFAPRTETVPAPGGAQPEEPWRSPAPAMPADSVVAGRLSAAENGALQEIAQALGPAGHRVDPEERPSAEIVPLQPRPRMPEATRVLDRLPVPTLVLRDDVAIFANRAMLDLAGHDDLPSWVSKGGLPAFFGRELAFPADGTPAALTVRTSDGGRATVSALRAEISWGDAPALLVSLLPLPDPAHEQELRAAALELETSRARIGELEASLDLAADGIVTLDGSGRILSLSRSAETLFGYAANEIVGEVITALLAPEDHRDALACIESASRTPGRAVECEARGRVSAGIARPFSIRIGVVAGATGPIYLLAFRDLSPFKALEGELREARGAAERAGANRADFLARISHEIRTPLTAITGFAELMLEERFGPLGSERYKSYARDIHGSGGHVISLVNDLLDLAKASSGRSDLTPADLDLNQIVSQCVTMSGPLSGREKTILRTSLEPRIPRIRADERSVRQIVLNVLTNAIRFTGAGGQVIVSTASAKPGEVRLSVRDTGPGMSESEIEAALTPFRQVSATRRGDGTGLGLPLSKALVEANGGVFAISSARGRGTLIAIHLPAAERVEEAIAAE